MLTVPKPEFQSCLDVQKCIWS